MEASAAADSRPARLTRALERLPSLVSWLEWDDRDVAPTAAPLIPSPAGSEAPEARSLTSEGGPYVRLLEADAADGQKGPLGDVEVAVKDLIAIAGLPLGAGSAVRQDAQPEGADAEIVQMLREAGARIVGTVTLNEFAFGVTGINDHAGFPRNPRDPSRIPGGSSSGSAVAVAEGSVDIALGSDTGGSIRIPAALCGVVGFKPAFGTYPAEGVFPLAPSMDHVGLLASGVALVQDVHRALGFDPGTKELPGKVGLVERDLETAQPEVARSVEGAVSALQAAGAKVGPVELPASGKVFAVSTAILFSEAAAVHRRGLEVSPQLYSDQVRERLIAGLEIEAATYVAAKQEQERLRREFGEAITEFDVVVGPAVPMFAPEVEEARGEEMAADLVRYTRLANVVGAPALSLPIPGSELPVGLQVASGDNASLLGFSASIEQVLHGS